MRRKDWELLKPVEFDCYEWVNQGMGEAIFSRCFLVVMEEIFNQSER